jgi:hypothetical protein
MCLYILLSQQFFKKDLKGAFIEYNKIYLE